MLILAHLLIRQHVGIGYSVSGSAPSAPSRVDPLSSTVSYQLAEMRLYFSHWFRRIKRSVSRG